MHRRSRISNTHRYSQIHAHTHTPSLVPQDTKWFDMVSHMDREGRRIERAVGVWCWCCGVASEAWPLLDKQAVIEKFHAGGDFRRDFNMVRGGVREADRHVEESSVAKQTSIGMRVFTTAYFVTVPTFTIFFHLPPGSVSGVTVVTVPSPEGGADLEGVLFSREDFPADLPHYIVEIYAESTSRLSEMVLSAPDVLRVGQAGETWKFSNNHAVTQRPAGLKVANINKLITVGRAQSMAEQVQREREQREGEQGVQEAANEVAMSTTVQAVSGSRLGKLAAPAPIAPKAKPRARGAGGQKGAAPRGAVVASTAASARHGGGSASVGGSVRSFRGGGASEDDGMTLLSMNTPPSEKHPGGLDFEAILSGWQAGREILGVVSCGLRHPTW